MSRDLNDLARFWDTWKPDAQARNVFSKSFEPQSSLARRASITSFASRIVQGHLDRLQGKSPGEQDDHAAPLNVHPLAGDRLLLPRLGDVLRRRPRRVHNQAPLPSRHGRDLELQPLGVHVQ